VFGKLLLLFILVPLAELYLFMTLGRALGTGNTILIIIATAFLGASLAKSQGRLAMANFQKAMTSGKMPHNEVLDGLMILIAGAVLLTPGFLTDAVGFALLFPPVRALIRGAFAEKLKDKIQVVGPRPSMGPSSTNAPKTKSRLDDGNVIDV